jgi:hypothetical protein
MLATVTCSGGCEMGAFATVTIGHSPAFQTHSSLYHLSSRGKKTVQVRFSTGELRKLRSALAHHRRIVVELVGAIVDPAGNVEKRSRTRTLAIRG